MSFHLRLQAFTSAKSHLHRICVRSNIDFVTFSIFSFNFVLHTFVWFLCQGKNDTQPEKFDWIVLSPCVTVSGLCKINKTKQNNINDNNTKNNTNNQKINVCNKTRPTYNMWEENAMLIQVCIHNITVSFTGCLHRSQFAPMVSIF